MCPFMTLTPLSLVTLQPWNEGGFFFFSNKSSKELCKHAMPFRTACIINTLILEALRKKH